MPALLQDAHHPFRGGGIFLKIRVFLVFMTIVALAAAILPSSAAVFRNEPDGFSRLAWQTDVSAVKDLRHVRSEDEKGNPVSQAFQEPFEAFSRDAGPQEFSGIPVFDVKYLFWRNKMIGVSMRSAQFPGGKLDNRFKDAVFERFGKESGRKNGFPLGTVYGWSGDTTTAVLSNVLSHWSFTLYSSVLFNSRESVVTRARDEDLKKRLAR